MSPTPRDLGARGTRLRMAIRRGAHSPSQSARMRISTSTASGLVSASGGTGRLFWLDLFPNILASVERVSRTVSRGGYLLEVPSIKEKRRRFARRRFHELFCLLTRNWWA